VAKTSLEEGVVVVVSRGVRWRRTTTTMIGEEQQGGGGMNA